MQCSCGKTYKRERILSKHESICKYNILWNENKSLKLQLENKDKDKIKMRINSDTSWIKISNKQCLL
jgi:endonuclease I